MIIQPALPSGPSLPVSPLEALCTSSGANSCVIDVSHASCSASTIQLFDAKDNTPLGYISNTLDSGYLMIAPEGDAAVPLEVFYNCGSATSGVLVLPVRLLYGFQVSQIFIDSNDKMPLR